jgi:hypothetical protein
VSPGCIKLATSLARSPLCWLCARDAIRGSKTCFEQTDRPFLSLRDSQARTGAYLGNDRRAASCSGQTGVLRHGRCFARRLRRVPEPLTRALQRMTGGLSWHVTGLQGVGASPVRRSVMCWCDKRVASSSARRRACSPSAIASPFPRIMTVLLEGGDPTRGRETAPYPPAQRPRGTQAGT